MVDGLKLGVAIMAAALAAGAVHAQIELVSVESQKVHYRPGDTGLFHGAVRNSGNDKAAVVVHCELVRDLDERLPVGRRRVAMAAGETARLEFEAKIPDREFGYEVAMWIEGCESGRRRDFFSVSGNVGKVGIYGSSSRFVNYTDTFAWAPDDFGNLSPEQDSWIPGQTSRRWSKPELRRQIEQWHARGIKALTYGKGVSGGPDGYALLIDHPEWAALNQFGQLGGLDMSFDVWALRNWFVNDHQNDQGQQWYFWNSWTPNFYDPAVVRHGAEALVQSAEMFGWDGVRFDGQFDIFGGYDIGGAPCDRGEDRASINARNVRLMKEHIRRRFPDFVFGYNYGFPVARPTVADRAVCEGGGLVMDEGIRNSGDPQHPNNVWTNFARHIVRECIAVRKLGGCPLIFAMKASGADADYALAFCLAGGGQPYGWDYRQVKYPMLEFATRYSGLLWDEKLEAVDSPEQLLNIECDREIWWREWVRVDRPGRRRTRYILHLINPPPQERLGGTPWPEPIRDVRMRVKAPKGQTLKRAWVLTPVPEVMAVVRPARAGRGRTTVTVPEVRLWTVVVLDFGS